MPLNIGDLFAWASGVFWAIGAAMIGRFQGVPIPGMVMTQFFCTAVIAILAGAVTATATLSPPPLDALVQGAPVILGVSVLIFIPAVCIIFWAQKFLFPGRAGLLMMSEGLMAVLSASILLPEESMSLIAWLGAALIIGAGLAEVLLTPQQAPGAVRS